MCYFLEGCTTANQLHHCIGIADINSQTQYLHFAILLSLSFLFVCSSEHVFARPGNLVPKDDWLCILRHKSPSPRRPSHQIQVHGPPEGNVYTRVSALYVPKLFFVGFFVDVSNLLFFTKFFHNHFTKIKDFIYRQWGDIYYWDKETLFAISWTY